MYYRHYKGKFYQVLGMVRNVHTEEDMVYYKALYDSTVQYFVRNKSEFFANVNTGTMLCARFTEVMFDALPQEAQSFID